MKRFRHSLFLTAARFHGAGRVTIAPSGVMKTQVAHEEGVWFVCALLFHIVYADAVIAVYLCKRIVLRTEAFRVRSHT